MLLQLKSNNVSDLYKNKLTYYDFLLYVIFCKMCMRCPPQFSARPVLHVD